MSIAEARQPAVARQFACQDACQEPRVDIAAAEHEPDLAALIEPVGSDECREARGACAFDDRLLDGDQKRDCAFEIGLGHEEDIIDERPDDLLGQASGCSDGDTFRQRIAPDRERQFFHSVEHRRVKLRLDADHLDLRIDRLRSDCHS